MSIKVSLIGHNKHPINIQYYSYCCLAIGQTGFVQCMLASCQLTDISASLLPVSLNNIGFVLCSKRVPVYLGSYDCLLTCKPHNSLVIIL